MNILDATKEFGYGIIRVCGKAHPGTGRVFSPAIVRVVVGPFYLPGSRSEKGSEMFEKTKAKITAPIERATGIAALALVVALAALFLALGKVTR